MAEPKSAGLWANSVSGGAGHYSNLHFETAEDSDVKLDIKDLRNSNKLMHESIERVEDSLNRGESVRDGHGWIV